MIVHLSSLHFLTLIDPTGQGRHGTQGPIQSWYVAKQTGSKQIIEGNKVKNALPNTWGWEVGMYNQKIISMFKQQIKR